MKIDRRDVDILGIKLTSTSKALVLRFIRGSLGRQEKFLIVTPNPEQVLVAQKDEIFKKILNKASLSLPDGIGLLSAYQFLQKKYPEFKIFKNICIIGSWFKSFYIDTFGQKIKQDNLTLIKGREVFYETIKLANKKGWRVFLLGGENKMAVSRAVSNLQANFKKVVFASDPGPILDQSGNPVSEVNRLLEKDCLEKINRFCPQLLFVGFGAPKQEKWLFRNFGNLNIGGAMVIGRTLEYYAGLYTLPSEKLTRYGLEWLWRLLTGSTNIKRIYKAVILFPLAVLRAKLKES